MDNSIKVEMGFVQRRLPWIVGALMLVIFLITLNRWITASTALSLGRVAGWDWRPQIAAPLYTLLTWPIAWLPGGIQLFALNFFTALCGALALALLARSVAMLPHDRTKDQRQVERSDYSLLTISAAWLPPVLAALVCGLQLSFWENAIAASIEMLDLLVFAYLIRCLLEFRLSHNENWLRKLAFVYGLSVTNNYAMIGFFPAFLAALVWIKWATFFNWRFVGRMLLWGCLGLLLYLVLPLLASLKQPDDYSFVELLRTYLNQQKVMLLGAPRYLFIFLALTSLLPVLFIGIRWPASFGDTSPTGQALTNLTTHIIHFIFLAACLYVTFDFEFSPRHILFERYAGLPFYYLGALSIGYFAGYFLLVFGANPEATLKSWQRPSIIRTIAGKVLVAAIWILLVAIPVALAWKNYPILHARNSPALAHHSALLADSLPPQPTVVIGDDVTRLFALRAELRKRSGAPEHVLLESAALEAPAYHRFLAKRYPNRLAKPAVLLPGRPVNSEYVFQLLREASKTAGLYYIHPSYGYFFEHFYLKPVKAVYQMIPFAPSDPISPPTLTEAELRAQDEYWKQLRGTEIASLTNAIPTPRDRKRANAALFTEGVVGHFRIVYSRALNHFGFEAQRAGNLKLAANYFDAALQVNGGNLHALINKDYNERVQQGHPESLPPSSNILERIESIKLSLDQRLNFYGPPDEPSVSEFLALHFHSHSLFRQSAQWLERSLAFESTNINRRLFLISETLHMGMADRALGQIANLRSQPPVPLSQEDQIDLIRAEAWALFSKTTNAAASEKLLKDAQRRYPQDTSLYSTLADIYVATNERESFTNALALYEAQLRLQPDNIGVLMKLSALLITGGEKEKALVYIDRALKINPKDPYALFNHGLCHLHLAQIPVPPDTAHVDAALNDFLMLSSMDSRNYMAYWGIAECYRLKKSTKEALKFYQKFIDSAPRDHPDVPLAQQRIKYLRSGGN